jgi:hypothetical protein
MPPFALDVQVRTAPKAGNTAGQNEDAAAAAPRAGRVAVADGASEGWQSGPWAKALATAFVKAPPDPAGFADWLLAARAAGPRTPAGGSWYAEVKALSGAFSTLLGATFEEPKAGPGVKWRAVAVGDSCLFQVRAGKLLAAFPVESADEFGNRPGLVGSADHAPPADPQWFAGRAEPGDAFYLLTDAVAEWFLRAAAANARPWAELDTVAGDADAFARWVQALRDAKAMKNDDTTALRVVISEK